jgi:hypothetical protein
MNNHWKAVRMTIGASPLARGAAGERVGDLVHEHHPGKSEHSEQGEREQHDDDR